MPEFKRNFTAGKMNKDLNERLVPKGEYRDAMNIEVSTSEGSDVGTVQNILGNKALEGQDMVPLNSVCVGTVSDEKNDALYWFTTQKSWGSQPYNGVNLTHEDPQGLVNAKRDIIWEYKENILKPVFCGTGAISYVAYNSSGTNITWNTSNSTITFIDTAGTVLVGMDVEIWGYELINNIPVETVFSGLTVKSVSGANVATIDGDISFLDNSITTSQLKKTKFFLSTADGLGTSLNFDPNKIINSINIIDDMLFWSDSYDEPKKININRSKQGTLTSPQGVVLPTRLINEALDISVNSRVSCKKDNITVIRKAPLRPLTLKMSNTKREGLSNTIEMYSTNPTFAQQQVGDTALLFVDAIGGVHPDIRIGDFLKLIESGSGGIIADDYLLRVSIVEKYEGFINVPYVFGTIGVSSTQTLYKVKIQSLKTSLPSSFTNANSWTAELEDQDVLFERKFPRFAYRYKYIDNEYSSFSPFSQVAFLPDGEFNYQPIKAYNTAMLNGLKSLTLKDFIPNDIPLDVVSVDILYKNEVSPTIYLLDTLSPQDLTPPDKDSNPWNSFGSATGDGAHMGALDISTESIYAALPENQMLRSWDNVPKTAVAQEITGNRIVYGNYTQSYNMLLSEFSKSTLTPVISTVLGNRPVEGYNASKSIKSLRSYDIGVVWGDKYGRETPVFASSQGSTVVVKSEAVSSNYLSVELGDSPYWADYYKFYIKETSNEYYNLPVGRVYDAEDGNVWVSFPSVDRNKVQEDTYLILKKGMESNLLVEEQARYKIVAIENEAPEYVKTSFDIVAETNTGGSRPVNSCELWGGNFTTGSCVLPNDPFHAPEPGNKSFTISFDRWTKFLSTAAGNMGLPALDKVFEEIQANSVTDEMWVQFAHRPSLGAPTVSQRYLITRVEVDGDIDAANEGAFTIHLDQPIYGSGSNINDTFITANLDAGNDDIHVHFYRKSIKNKPEFDGRFFVKIFRDDLVTKHLIEPGSPTLSDTWVQVATVPVYSITETGNGTLDQNSPANANSSGSYYISSLGNNTSPPPNCSTCTESQWIDLLKFGTTSTTDHWFIDNATFASQHIGPLNNGIGNHLQVNLDLSIMTGSNISGNSSDITSSQSSSTTHWCGNVWKYASGTNGYITRTYNHSGDGLSNGRIGMKGVWTDSTNGNNYIDLSYSKHGPHGASGQTTSSDLNWALGTNENSSTLAQAAVVGSLAIDQRFRYSGDLNGVVYRITGVQKFRLFNYRGKRTVATSNASYNPPPQVFPGFNLLGEIDCDGDWNNVFMDQNKDMGRDYNRRTTYRIRYEIDPDASDPNSYTPGEVFSDHSLFSNISNSSKENIDFLDSYVTEENKEISENPAIFETEPKEGVDLDIYYEASSSIPVFPITNKNKYAYIPVGSTLSPSPYATLGSNMDLSTVFITSWDNISTNNPVNTIRLSTPIDGADLVYLIIDGKVDILKDNGEMVTVKIVGTEQDANGDVIAFKIEPQKKVGLSWFNCWSFNNGVESNRVGDTFNNPFITNGVAASTTTDIQYAEEHRKYGLIYSGIYNSTSGVNDLNQFIAAEKITKDINPVYGSIQKLKAGWGQGGDLITLCEDRVLKILANKDALFNADGNTNLTSTNNVLGQAIPYSGEYGISTNPESFASEAYRAYFTDKVRGTVMRLSMDGLTPISDYGMSDWFKDNLKINNTLIGSFDDKKNEYNISLSNKLNFSVYVPASSKALPPAPPFFAGNIFIVEFEFGSQIQVNDVISGVGIADGSTVVSKTLVNPGGGNPSYQIELDLDINGGAIGPVQSAGSIVNGVPTLTYFWNTTIYIEGSSDNTLTYKEKVKGWVSFKSFMPEQARSMANDYYTFKNGKAWVHHSDTVPRNTFYGGESDKSWIEVVINDIPSSVKSFKAVDYEGSQAKVTPSLNANNQLIQDGEYFNLIEEKGWYVSDFYTNLENGSVTEFVKKEGKWFGHTIGSDISITASDSISPGIINNNYDTSDFSVQGIGSFVSTTVNNVVGCMCDGVINDCYSDGLAAFNYSAAASIPCGGQADPNNCCIPTKLGCIDPLASNFDPLANTDDGSCIILGCIDEFGPSGILNSNYNPNATASDGSCIEYIPGCTDSTMFNFSSAATIACGGNTPIPGDGFGQANNYCCQPVVMGCIDSNADQITPGANTSDGTSCTYTGCTNPLASNYSFTGSNPLVDGTTGNQANLAYQSGFAIDNGLCVTGINPANPGCIDPLADNYDSTATSDDGSCQYCDNSSWPPVSPTPSNISGAGSSVVNNYFEAEINLDETYPGSSDGKIDITIPATSPYGSNSQVTLLGLSSNISGNTYYPTLLMGQTHVFTNLPHGKYELIITQNPSTFTGAQTVPCTQSFPYLLEILSGTEVLGCTDGDGNFNNYTMSDGSTGTFAACNYNPLATPGNPDATNCDYSTCVGCTDSSAQNYDPNATITDNGTCNYSGPNTAGCTDSNADNYNQLATIDDGSCAYCGNIVAVTPTPSAIIGAGTSLTNNYFTAEITSDETSSGANDGVITITIPGSFIGNPNASPFGFDSVPTLVDDAGNIIYHDVVASYTSLNSIVFVFNNLPDDQYDLTITQGPSNYIGAQAVPCVLNYTYLLEVLPGAPTSTSGCTDPAADNYDANAINDDGSCTYPPGPLQVGDSAFGGIIAYIFKVGDAGYIAGEQHGIIVATTDNTILAPWGCQGTALYPGANGQEIGDGNQNTIDIIAGCTDTPIAAEVASNYTDGIYTDWFLPSNKEIEAVYSGVGHGGTGTNSNGVSNVNIANMASSHYWSSSEENTPWIDPTVRALSRDFSPNVGYLTYELKGASLRSRSVRYF